MNPHADSVQAPSGQQAEETNEQAAHDEWWGSHSMGAEFNMTTKNQSRAAWHERARRAALAGHQSERPAPAGQAVGEAIAALEKAREFVKSRKAPGYDIPCMQAHDNINMGITALASSQAERPAEGGK
jgi:hypothetical protein